MDLLTFHAGNSKLVKIKYCWDIRWNYWLNEKLKPPSASSFKQNVFIFVSITNYDSKITASPTTSLAFLKWNLPPKQSLVGLFGASFCCPQPNKFLKWLRCLPFGFVTIKCFALSDWILQCVETKKERWKLYLNSLRFFVARWWWWCCWWSVG